jgi:hypothetical protein
MSIGNTIHFLQVPYAEKDEAKALGARWNAERKQWYYYGEEDGRFEKWTPTPVMQLSDLSEEQQSMIALAKTGKNVLVDACIGSGKTTTIQVLCNEVPEKNVLYLTYNTLLKVDAKEKIRARNVTVTNYHGFASMCLEKAHLSAGISDLIQTFLKNKERIRMPKYDLLVIDEYQDIEQEIPDSLKDCDIEMRQYDCYDDVIDINNIYVEAFCYDNALCYKKVTFEEFEEAEKMDGYKSVILA